MELAAIRNNRQREALLEQLKGYRLPFKIVVQEIYPARSVDANAYYWGVITKMIAIETGHTAEELHEYYKRMFLVDYAPNKKNEWSLRVKSTTELDQREFMSYALKVRAQAMLDLGIDIPLPNEVIVNEKV